MRVILLWCALYEKTLCTVESFLKWIKDEYLYVWVQQGHMCVPGMKDSHMCLNRVFWPNVPSEIEKLSTNFDYISN
jgi:hypothetical protein